MCHIHRPSEGYTLSDTIPLCAAATEGKRVYKSVKRWNRASRSLASYGDCGNSVLDCVWLGQAWFRARLAANPLLRARANAMSALAEGDLSYSTAWEIVFEMTLEELMGLPINAALSAVIAATENV